MSGRIFLVIFFFWALLAIVTPTLVLLSESSKPYLDSNVEKSVGLLKLRRMMENLEKQSRIEEIALAPLQAPTPAPVSEPEPEPEPDPEPVSGIREAILKRFLKRR